jgi:hypothetical protein
MGGAYSYREGALGRLTSPQFICARFTISDVYTMYMI